MTTTDRQLQVFEDWDRKQQQRIRALITDDIIEEHERSPLGQHSDTLERVLAYFRRQPTAGKYLVVAEQPWENYRVGVLTGRRGEPAEILDDGPYPTEEAATHAVFLHRVRDLQEA